MLRLASVAALALTGLTACSVVHPVADRSRVGSLPSADALTRDSIYAEPSQVVVEGDTLHGEYLIPAGAGPFPLVLLYPGSGPTDRDGNVLPGVRNNSLLYLARELAQRGVATLRVDKRGIGQSAAAQPSEIDLRFSDYVGDAAAWLRQARADSRFDTVVAGGHSEGGLVAAFAAPEARADGLVLLSTLGRSPGVVVREQVRRNAPFLYPQADSVLTRIEAGESDVPSPPGLEALFRPSVQPYLRSLLVLDPVAAVAAVETPVLVVQGTTDLNVTDADADALAAARPGVRLVRIEGMNHVLKSVRGDLSVQAPSYADPALPLAEGLADVVADFALALGR